MTDNSDDDDIGYGKPPKKHQFQKGQSGCPDGGHKQRAANKAAHAKAQQDKERRKEKDLKNLVKKVLLEDQNVITSAGPQTMPTLEVVLRNAIARAAKKDASDRHVAQALKLADKVGLLDPPPEKGRAMVLVVNPIMKPDEWAKATEGELLPRNPLHGIPGAEGMLETLDKSRGKIPDDP